MNFKMKSNQTEEFLLTDQKSIRLLLVDDNEILRETLTDYLGIFEDIDVVGAAANGVEGIELCAQLLPDVALIDLVMPEMDGITAIGHISKQFPEIALIAFSSYSYEYLYWEAIRAGASYYLVKDENLTDRLINMIRAAWLQKNDGKN